MLKHANAKGFTIIEVVITIAIGAAVMALVLNAVQGARRSQRNNARVADVGAIATAVNNYYGSRNALPANTADIDDPLINQLAYYPDAGTTEIAAIFANNVWTVNAAAALTTHGNFVEIGSTATAYNATSNPVADIAVNAAVATATTTAGVSGTNEVNPGTNLTVDNMALVLKAACNADFSAVVAGGIREMAIVYRLEGQDGLICREI